MLGLNRSPREKLLHHHRRIKEGPTRPSWSRWKLMSEMQYPLGQPHRTPDDYWCAFLLQLDKWELTDDRQVRGNPSR